MLCYKDKTFCSFYEDCSGAKECGRSLTPDIRVAADKWWGSEGAPIMVFITNPECWKSNSPESPPGI